MKIAGHNIIFWFFYLMFSRSAVFFSGYDLWDLYQPFDKLFIKHTTAGRTYSGNDEKFTGKKEKESLCVVRHVDVSSTQESWVNTQEIYFFCRFDVFSFPSESFSWNLILCDSLLVVVASALILRPRPAVIHARLRRDTRESGNIQLSE